MNLLSQSTYLRAAKGLAKKLHLSALLGPASRWWTAPRLRVVNVSTFGLSCKMRLDPGDLRDREWDIDHGERDFLDALEEHLRPGETALDVGAHVGEFTLPLAKLLGEKGCVLSFEPVENACQRLVEHVKLNGLTNVQVFRKALGEEEKAGKIFFGGGNCPSIVPLDSDTTRRSISENIEIVRGDTFFARAKLPVPNAVKIDVEGFEYAVLRGLRGTLASPNCRLVCVEIHPEVLPSGVTTETIRELLKSLGFGSVKTEQRDEELHLVAVKLAHTP